MVAEALILVDAGRDCLGGDAGGGDLVFTRTNYLLLVFPMTASDPLETPENGSFGGRLLGGIDFG
jgi:hypothetical protein